ncbi:DUF4260 family protein [Georgenia muralis]
MEQRYSAGTRAPPRGQPGDRTERRTRGSSCRRSRPPPPTPHEVNLGPDHLTQRVGRRGRVACCAHGLTGVVPKGREHVAHSYLGPAALLAVTWASDARWPAFVALTWAFHIAVDRLLGYGLKFTDRFTHPPRGDRQGAAKRSDDLTPQHTPHDSPRR